MANEKKQPLPFRFWNPFWGSAPSTSDANSKPQATVAGPAAPTPGPTKRSTPRIASSPGKPNQPRRASRTTPSILPPPSRTPSPSPSPSRRPSRPDQVKQNTKGKPSNQQGATPDDTMSHNDLKIIDIKPTPQPQASKTQEQNASKDLEKIEPKSIRSDSLIDDAPTKAVITDKNPRENDDDKEEEEGSKHHEPKPPKVQLDGSTTEEVLETHRREENKQTHNNDNNEAHDEDEITRDKIKHMSAGAAPTQADNLGETIREIAEKPTLVPESNPEGTLKDVAAQPSGVNDLSSSSSSSSSYNNKSDHSEKENPIANNPAEKEKSNATSSSSRTSFQKNIKEGISKLVQKINTGNGLNPGSERGMSTSIITLAGENKGASMYIGQEKEGHNGNSIATGGGGRMASASASNREEEIEDEKDARIAANVNSNVQSVNNSMLQESRCDTRDPGVHLRLTSRMKKDKLK